MKRKLVFIKLKSLDQNDTFFNQSKSGTLKYEVRKKVLFFRKLKQKLFKKTMQYRFLKSQS